MMSTQEVGRWWGHAWIPYQTYSLFVGRNLKSGKASNQSELIKFMDRHPTQALIWVVARYPLHEGQYDSKRKLWQDWPRDSLSQSYHKFSLSHFSLSPPSLSLACTHALSWVLNPTTNTQLLWSLLMVVWSLGDVSRARTFVTARTQPITLHPPTLIMIFSLSLTHRHTHLYTSTLIRKKLAPRRCPSLNSVTRLTDGRDVTLIGFGPT